VYINYADDSRNFYSVPVETFGTNDRMSLAGYVRERISRNIQFEVSQFVV
jgi:hypothetical protein